MSSAFITGVTGQDGSYLAEHLLELGYEVVGIVRDPSAAAVHPNLAACAGRITFVRGDLENVDPLIAEVSRRRPDEFYNLGAQASSRSSWNQRERTAIVNGLAVSRLLEGIRLRAPDTRFFQASSSEIFGISPELPATEETALNPANPYAVAKSFAQLAVAQYREAYGLFACGGILFNHESPRRPEHFVSRRIAKGVARIKAGASESLELGAPDARRDWGSAKEFVRGYRLALSADSPGDYVFATGKNHSVEEFCVAAFRCAGLDAGKYARFDRADGRKAGINETLGNPAKAERELGWKDRVPFEALVAEMVEADLSAL